jgi:hypothetical protein
MSNCAGGQSASLFKEDGADNVVLQLEHHRATAVFEVQNLIHRGGGQSFDPCNPIPNCHDSSLFGHPQAELIVAEPLGLIR